MNGWMGRPAIRSRHARQGSGDVYESAATAEASSDIRIGRVREIEQLVFAPAEKLGEANTGGSTQVASTSFDIDRGRGVTE